MQHQDGGDWREHARTHGPNGPLVDAGALIYQHTTKDRDAAIAAALSRLVHGTISTSNASPFQIATCS